jgi:hypothetical protein
MAEQMPTCLLHPNHLRRLRKSARVCFANLADPVSALQPQRSFIIQPQVAAVSGYLGLPDYKNGPTLEGV